MALRLDAHLVWDGQWDITFYEFKRAMGGRKLNSTHFRHTSSEILDRDG